MRYADFGVLHRNELSGALTGLTRVRRFQQDDGHIFIRDDQIEEEVLGALEFMKYVYGIFGMTYKLELSTRPKKAMGDVETWNNAEASLERVLNKFEGEGNWRVNPGDGAFYGPKIDIKIFDAMQRVHQCATVQLDFQVSGLLIDSIDSLDQVNGLLIDSIDSLDQVSGLQAHKLFFICTNTDSCLVPFST
jgi:threonyl-tRNA synthetase